MEDGKDGKAILVIDDEHSILDLVRMNLELAGYEVVTGVSGQEALQLVASCYPAMLILDVMLPDQSGYHVLRHLRENGEHLPVIMLTAKGERETISLPRLVPMITSRSLSAATSSSCACRPCCDDQNRLPGHSLRKKPSPCRAS